MEKSKDQEYNNGEISIIWKPKNVSMHQYMSQVFLKFINLMKSHGSE
jgi:hypothetical protein